MAGSVVDDDSIMVKVVDGNGRETLFKIKKSTKFEKVINAYCDKYDVNKDFVRFVYNGLRVKDDATPEKLGLDADSEIQAMIEQLGGRGSSS